jgi:phosphoribosyl 1,2-cyclic phosphodiesterase
MGMEFKLWGIRGSLATPKTPDEVRDRVEEIVDEFAKSKLTRDDIPAFVEKQNFGGFGGHTTSIEVTTPKRHFILDAGSGIRNVGGKLLAGPCGKGQGEAHILFTHFHWDHIIGLPFFVPILIPGNKIHIYSVQENAEEVVRMLFKKPYFPLEYDYLGGEIIYHKLEPRKKVHFDDLAITPYQLDHPDPTWGFRFEHEGKVVAYCCDTEGTRMTPEEMGEDHDLYKGADVMFYDAQYTLKETSEKQNWGHASATIGLDIALREEIKRVYFVHHDPFATDEKIQDASNEAGKYLAAHKKYASKSGIKVPDIDWSFAVEGATITI